MRHELSFNAATNLYESYDSSYIKFDMAAQIMYFANGTQVKYGAYSYSTNNRDFQALPSEIKDRNGNFITIAYRTLTFAQDNYKLVIDYVIDTAGRRIDFEYQNNRLTGIKQDRNGTAFYFVRLDYAAVTIQTGYSTTDPALPNGTQVWMPVRLTYPTGLSLRFAYNGYAQISAIERWAPTINGQGAERKLAATSFVYDVYYAPTLLSQRSEWAENWQGATYSYALGHSGPSVRDSLGRFYEATLNGLQLIQRVYAAGGDNALKRTTTTYQQDAGLAYRSNPRVTELEILDSSNGAGYATRRSTFDYTQQNGMWLPWRQYEYLNGITLYRFTETTYTHYPTQRLLGLPAQVSLYTGAGALLSRLQNTYDEQGSFTDSSGQLAQFFKDETGAGVIQHDNTNYGGSFVQRGNLTSVTQWSVVNGAFNGSRPAKRIGYDTNGNARWEADALGNRQQVEYSDYYTNKPAGVGPTQVYGYTTADPTGFRLGAQHEYFTGNLTKTFNLLAGSSTEQQVLTTNFDFADRPWLTFRPDGVWVRTDYWDNWLAVGTAQQIEAGKHRFKWAISDGAGRAFKQASDHPDGVWGKYAGQLFVFDSEGRVQDSSNVLTVNGSFTPSFEDVGSNWLFTHMSYDTFSRLLMARKPDNNEVHIDYEGCGCAGNMSRRVTDELGHYTETKTDSLGRLAQAVEPGSGTTDGIYSKAVYSYDELDRLVAITHMATYNTTTGYNPSQTRTFGYDGYGRLANETPPEAGTVYYSYTANDQLAAKTDARGVTLTQQYNTRNQVTQMSYSGASAPTVSYGYDAYGARQTMSDGEGQTSYSYNGFRQLQSETRTFTGLPGKTAALSYTYNQADQIKSVNYSFTSNSAQLFERPTARRDASALLAATLPARATRRGGPKVATGLEFLQGMVTHAVTGQPMSGVTVTAYRPDDPVFSLSAQTNASGAYLIEAMDPERTYLVSASKSGYVFSPSQVNSEYILDSTQGFSGLEATASGSLTASPNPIQVCNGGTLGTTTQNWSTSGVINVQIRKDAPNGTLITSGGASGSYNTGQTVAHGTVYYLQNVTNGANSTLATVTVNLTTQGCPPPPVNFNKTVNYTYNAAGALSSVGTNLLGSDPNNTTNVLNTTTFRASGAIKSLIYGNGRQLTMGYNANRQQPISMKVDRVGNPADKIIDYAYEYYDAQGKNNNRIRTITDNVDSPFTVNYLYDDYNRLTSATAGFYFRFYYYDAFGNITNFSAAAQNYALNATGAPATNRILNVNGGAAFSYDNAGNLTAGDGVSYAYDGASRLSNVNGGAAGQYGYDGDGARVKKVESGATMFYVRSSKLGQVAFEVTGAGVQRAYVYAGGKTIAQLSTDGQLYWLHTNHLGSARAMTDTSGNLFYKGQFDPYGQAVAEWSATGNTNLNTKKFTGYERDAATGLDYANARTYTNLRGRFMQPDIKGLGAAAKLGRPQSLNRYAYVSNDPINFVDSNGLDLEGWECVVFSRFVWNDQRWKAEICSPVYSSQRDPSGSSGGGDQGGRGGGGNTGKSNCGQFIDKMLNLADPSNYPYSQGHLLVLDAFFSHDKSLPTEGFKSEFTQGGQGGEVFAHLKLHIGATLIGNGLLIPPINNYYTGGQTAWTGTQLSQLTRAQDQKEWDDADRAGDIVGVLQHTAELNADNFGVEMGNAILDIINGRKTLEQVKGDLFGKLCDK